MPPEAPDFVQRVTAMILAGKGDLLPVSAFPVDGTWPVSPSTRWSPTATATLRLTHGEQADLSGAIATDTSLLATRTTLRDAGRVSGDS